MEHAWDIHRSLPDRPLLCSKGRFFSFPLVSLSVFVLYPSSLHPHSSPYSLCGMRTPQEIWYCRRSLKFWTAVELLSWWFTHFFQALSASEAETYSNTTPLLREHIQENSTRLCVLRCTNTPSSPSSCSYIHSYTAYKVIQIWIKAKSRLNMFLYTAVEILNSGESFQKRQKSRLRQPRALQYGGCSGNVKALHLLQRHKRVRQFMHALWMSNFQGMFWAD